jgi:hypothetical protein
MVWMMCGYAFKSKENCLLRLLVLEFNSAQAEYRLRRSHVGGQMQSAVTDFVNSAIDLRGVNAGQLLAAPACLPGRLNFNGLAYTALQLCLSAPQRLEMHGG